MKTKLFLITFLLITPTIFAQSIEDIVAIQQIDTLLYSGPKDNRINFVIQNRGAQNPDDEFNSREEFVELLEGEFLKAFTPGDGFAQTPYAEYRNFFNLYAFWWPDAPSDQEGWNSGVIQQIRDRIFLPWTSDTRGWVSLLSTTKHGGKKNHKKLIGRTHYGSTIVYWN